MYKDKMLIKADNFFIAHECTFVVDSLKYVPSQFVTLYSTYETEL